MYYSGLLKVRLFGRRNELNEKTTDRSSRRQPEAMDNELDETAPAGLETLCKGAAVISEVVDKIFSLQHSMTQASVGQIGLSIIFLLICDKL